MSRKWKILGTREFWDLPRMIVASRGEELVLFYSRFCDDRDDYNDYYERYRLPSLSTEDLTGTWEGLEDRAIERLPDLPLNELPFDWTDRVTR